MTNLPVELPLSIDEEMERVLQQMLENDENITARGVVNKLECLKAASSITRNLRRVAMLKVFQERQKEFRKWQTRAGKTSKENIAQALAVRDLKIAELQRQVELLTASHIAMIRVVGELGGYELLPVFKTLSIVVSDETGGSRWYVGNSAESTSLRQ